MSYREMTVGEYLWKRCMLMAAKKGNRRLNALPGDFALPLFREALKSGMDYCKACNEQECAAAASGDARFYHYGFMLVTYGVGMENVIGFLSMDIAEQQRTLYVSGAADWTEHGRKGAFNPGQVQLLHHYDESLGRGEEGNQFRSIARRGIPAEYVDDPGDAMEKIDRVLEGMEKFSLPGYLEISRNVAVQKISVPAAKTESYLHYWDKQDVRDTIDSFKEYIGDKMFMVADEINRSLRPVLVTGNMVKKYKLEKAVENISRKTGAAITATQLGIGIFSDNYEGYAGIYSGASGTSEEIREAVEDSDCVIAIGVSERETNSGIFTADLNYRNIISINTGSVHLKGWKMETGDFWDGREKPDTASIIEYIAFTESLAEADLLMKETYSFPSFADYLSRAYPPLNEKEYADLPLTIDLMINLLNNGFISGEMRLASDFGDCAMMATRLRTAKGLAASSVDGHMNTGFGFLFGAQPQEGEAPVRTLMLMGDGAAQMNMGGFITMNSRGITGATVIILDDNCYKTLYLIDRDSGIREAYSLPEVNYAAMGDVTGNLKSFTCCTGGEFAEALTFARGNDRANTLIVAKLNREDASPPLRGLAAGAGSKISK